MSKIIAPYHIIRRILRNQLTPLLRSYSRKKCLIYTSSNTNPYDNLAFEDWMYEKVDFRQVDCLYIWRNRPCVVIGRHQNPWKEIQISKIKKDSVELCRRNSGGGAVYHDLGNVNFTFFTDKEGYNRKQNLQVIIDGLNIKWPFLDITINKRDDIVLNKNFKVSGSSAKLGRLNSYHHCTLLLNSNKKSVTKYLTRSPFEIHCTSTKSTPSKVMNLSDVNPNISYDSVCTAVSNIYADKHSEAQHYSINTRDEKLLPGIRQISEKLKTWDWIYSRTPNFSVKNRFDETLYGSGLVKIDIKKGVIEKIFIISDNFNDKEIVASVLNEHLIGLKFVWMDISKCIDDHELQFQTPEIKFICYLILQLLE